MTDPLTTDTNLKETPQTDQGPIEETGDNVPGDPSGFEVPEAPPDEGAEKKVEKNLAHGDKEAELSVQTPQDGVGVLAGAVASLIQQGQQQQQILAHLFQQQQAQHEALMAKLSEKTGSGPPPVQPAAQDPPQPTQQAFSMMPPPRPVPALPVKAKFRMAWEQTPPYERIVKVQYLGETTQVPFGPRNTLNIPPYTSLDLSELQDLAEYFGWPNVEGLRFWLEKAEPENEGERHLGSMVCRPQSTVMGQDPKLTLLMQALEREDVEEPESEEKEGIIDHIVEAMRPYQPQLQALVAGWFAANKDRIVGAIGRLMTWLSQFLLGMGNSGPAQPQQPAGKMPATLQQTPQPMG